MAVEAHHLHLFPPQLLRSREIMNAIESQSGVYNTQMGVATFVPFGPTTADSGLTFNDIEAVSASRKRAREPTDRLLSFLGEDFSAHIHHQMQETERLIAQHAEKVRAELAERRRRFWRQALAAMEERLSKRFKAKDEEIERIKNLNWAMEERIRGLCVEAQIWQDLAQTNEAAANALRANLEQVLAAQAEERCEADAAEDAESCCGGDGRRDTAIAGGGGDWRRRLCRNCGEGEPSVLLLPCRHLCICAACDPAVDACPICNCSKDGTVNVNIV